MSEMEVAYKQYNGFRISSAAWYDQAYADTDVETSPGNVYYPGAFPGTSTSSYTNGHYSGFTKRYHRGPAVSCWTPSPLPASNSVTFRSAYVPVDTPCTGAMAC